MRVIDLHALRATFITWLRTEYFARAPLRGPVLWGFAAPAFHVQRSTEGRSRRSLECPAVVGIEGTRESVALGSMRAAHGV